MRTISVQSASSPRVDSLHAEKTARNRQRIFEGLTTWPPDLKTLFLSQDIAPWFLFSPSVDHPYFTRADFEANSPGLAPGAPGAYIYVGNRVKPTNDDAVVLMYEPMSNHGDGFHILFADGHAEFLTGSTAQKVLAELQAGQNPPPSH